MKTLYHYTCAHSINGIRADSYLRGNRHPLLPDSGQLVWMTDLDVPDVLALGLTSYSLACDRTEYRVVADADAAVRWPVFARRMSSGMRAPLERCPGALPMHWWVAADAHVPVLATT